MRLFTMLCRSRKPQNPKRVPLATPRLPFALRDRVSGTKLNRDSSAPALKEMQNLITKLSQNDWNQEFCRKEIADMQKANTESYLNALKETRENRMGVIKPGSQLDPIPLTKYLRSRYPIPQQNPFEEKLPEIPEHKKKR